MHELDRHRSFAHGRRAALRGAGADVARREDPRDIGLEEEVGSCFWARDDKAVGIAGHRVAEPIRARRRPEEEEQERERNALAVDQRDRLELAVLAVDLRYLAGVADRDAVAVELADEIGGHRLAQGGAAMQQRPEPAPTREPDGGLTGGVASSDDPCT